VSTGRWPALAYALSGSRLGADDLAQEAFLAAYRDWQSIGRYNNPGAWVRRVVDNRSVSMFRRRSAELRPLIRLRNVLSQRPTSGFWQPGRSSAEIDGDTALW